MNILQQFYPGDAAASFLVRVLVEITLVMSVSLLISRIIGRRNPLSGTVCWYAPSSASRLRR